MSTGVLHFKQRHSTFCVCNTCLYVYLCNICVCLSMCNKTHVADAAITTKLHRHVSLCASGKPLASAITYGISVSCKPGKWYRKVIKMA